MLYDQICYTRVYRFGIPLRVYAPIRVQARYVYRINRIGFHTYISPLYRLSYGY